MPLIYADTSTLFAYFHPGDSFSETVDAAVAQHSPDFAYWPLLRFELRHNLRRLQSTPHGGVAWRALRAAENTSARLRWQSDLATARVIESAEELSAKHGDDIFCGSGDVLHVAAARRLKLLAEFDEFWTCDDLQAKFARACGLKTRLFK